MPRLEGTVETDLLARLFSLSITEQQRGGGDDGGRRSSRADDADRTSHMHNLHCSRHTLLQYITQTLLWGVRPHRAGTCCRPTGGKLRNRILYNTLNSFFFTNCDLERAASDPVWLLNWPGRQLHRFVRTHVDSAQYLNRKFTSLVPEAGERGSACVILGQCINIRSLETLAGLAK